MAKVKHTKNELKAQRDALRRFERYLPTLQLKKQQLQIEVRQLDVSIREKAAEETAAREGLAPWIALFSEDVDFSAYIRLKSVRKTEGNVAGVAIPVLEDLELERMPVDLFQTPAWLDDGLAVLEQLMRLRVERQVLEEQHRRLAEELRVTAQRVNLFEKVKIPESRENIRVIRIFLGDEMTAGVARGKIAKAKTLKKGRDS
jgi:V/A-type H+-transporting ATPase subunit D